MKEIYGIQMLLQVRERVSQKIFIDDVICLKFPEGKRFIKVWGHSGKDDEVGLNYDVVSIVVDLLSSTNVHTQQKIGSKVIQSLKNLDWFCDSCVLEVIDFESVAKLESWYVKNSKSIFDKFLNKDV